MERLASIRGAARRDPFAADAVLAAALAVVGQLELWTSIDGTDRAVVAPCSLLMTAPLAWRRRAPLATVAVVMAAWAAQSLLVDAAEAPLTANIAIFVALYSSAAYAGPTQARAGGAIGLVTAWLATSREHGSTPGDYFLVTLLTGSIWAAGLVLRRSRLRAAALERDSEEQARAAVAEERERIARELHDVIAHCVSLMVVQAGAERRVLSDDRRSTREALLSIEQTGRQALAEMRRLVDMLDRGGEPVGLAPQPSVEQLGQLAEQVREAGLPVELRVEGEPEPLSPGVDLSAYRIVQEGLTNALKHAGAAHARVTVRYGGGRLDLEVADDGNGAGAGESGGHGLVGMRERAALFGGALDAGPRADGGYAVHATLPLQEGAP